MDGADGGLNDKSFGCKPARGWSYADNIISNEGVTFNVRVCILKRKMQFSFLLLINNRIVHLQLIRLLFYFLFFFFCVRFFALKFGCSVHRMPRDKDLHEIVRLSIAITRGKVSESKQIDAVRVPSILIISNVNAFMLQRVYKSCMRTGWIKIIEKAAM